MVNQGKKKKKISYKQEKEKANFRVEFDTS